ncbi:MAG: lytic transglycosylase domain-containing protein [Gammaproteobacteria bacterium]
MYLRRRPRRKAVIFPTSIKLLLSLPALLILATCSSPPIKPTVTAPANTDFPTSTALEPQVDFWRKVYALWRTDQVVLHDDRYLQLVYEVIDLPSATGNNPALEQDVIKTRQRALQQQLHDLEQTLAMQAPLAGEQQQLAERISKTAGAGAIAGAAERLRNQRGLKEKFKLGLEISGRYERQFRQIFRNAGLPEDLALLPHVESSFQNQARSNAGAVGMWQFTRGAANLYMRRHPALDERRDPVASARAAARYLGEAYAILGNWPLALTSYNHGMAGIRKASELYGPNLDDIIRLHDGSRFGFASRNFYAEFLAAREIALAPQRFFPEGIVYQTPRPLERIVLERAASVAELARNYGVDQATLADLNPAWTAVAFKDTMTLPEGIEVWLPSGALARAEQIRYSASAALSQSGNLTPVPILTSGSAPHND